MVLGQNVMKIPKKKFSLFKDYTSYVINKWTKLKLSKSSMIESTTSKYQVMLAKKDIIQPMIY
uniref:Putative ovule protein n=1 Tax=Solanum chacoense TaxID=4108 RepID=A0A0V0HNF1_SOLCH